MTIEEALTRELRSVAATLDTPVPPAIGDLVDRARRERTRNRAATVVVASLAAAAVVAAVVGFGVPFQHPDASPAIQPTGMRTGGPLVPYRVGTTLYVDGVARPGAWSSVQTFGRTTVATVDGTGKTSTVAVLENGTEIARLENVVREVVVSPDGSKLAWIETTPGKVDLVVRDVAGGRDLGRLPLDRVDYLHEGEENEGWSSLGSVANDGTASYGNVVVTHTWTPGSEPVDQDPAQLQTVPPGYPDDAAGVVISPDGTYGAWLSEEPGVTVQRPDQPSSRETLAVPAGSFASMLTWESATDVIVTVDDSEGTRTYFLRCSVVERRCIDAPAAG